jgi:hypothetical protein
MAERKNTNEKRSDEELHKLDEELIKELELEVDELKAQSLKDKSKLKIKRKQNSEYLTTITRLYKENDSLKAENVEYLAKIDEISKEVGDENNFV